MIKSIISNLFIKLPFLVIASIATPVYAGNAFNCPQPAEIQSTDFTVPSIWVAPPVAHSVAGAVGVGLGGKEVKEFLGSEPAQVNHKQGWVCVYKTDGVKISEYQAKILQTVESNHYLRKYSDKVKAEYRHFEPYLKNYPQDVPLGFVGYQSAN